MKKQSTKPGLFVKKTTKVHLIIFFLMLCSGIFTKTHAQYVPPTHVDGAAPNGILWDTVLTGRTLPVRTTTAGFNGLPGAVMFYDKATGKFGINPNGLSLNAVIVTYTSGNANVGQTFTGPFIYPGGTTTNSYSPTTGTPRTFPAPVAVTGLPPTTIRARFAFTIGAPLSPALATTGDANNIASTNGYLNQPWSFGSVVNIDSLIANNQALADSNFKVVGQASNANANLLGYGAPWGVNGNSRGVFQYGINGVLGNQLGAIVFYSSTPTCTAPTLSSSITNQSCSNLNNGAINLTATGGSPAPTFAWSGPNSFTSTTEDISNLAPGQYTVTATSGTCTATANYTVTAGTQPTMPTLACYETATFNSSTCVWDVTGTQPSAPTGLACYETANFNTTSCSWDVTGSQPSMPTLACYETASFNSSTCVWDVTGTIPTTPTLACYETASFNTTSCAWDVTGSQPQQPTLACYESASFNTTTCVWDVTGTQPSAPTGLACYETATFNSSTCAWDVTGSQPQQPTLACYETATFNSTTCAWDVTGTQPSAPTGLACYETATFNSSTCAWDVTGSPAAAIVTTTTDCQSYTWSANGTTYTQSGTYNYSANCQDYTLNLTITASTSTVYYADVDGDGYGNASSTTTSCNGAPTGYVSQAGDCNDNNANINPAASEVCGNSIDDNCNGTTDEGTTVNANPISGNLQICNLYAGAKILTTTTVADASSYIWTVPSDMTIDSGQGTTSIVVSWGNINLLQNGIVGNVTVTPVLSTTGCVTVVPASIPVDLQYTAPVTPPSISGPNAICPNESGVYSIALVKRATSYEWSVPTGASITSGASSNIINVSYANGFTGGSVTVRSKNVCGLSASLRSRTVALNVLPAPASITGPIDGLCNASNANYSATAVVGATGYNWTVPATGSINGGSTNNNISVNYNSSFASGNITVAAVNNCGAGATRSLSLKAAPATPGTLSGPASACAGSTQSYAISTVQGASNYIWTVPGGAVINSGQGTKNLNVNHSTNASASGIITVKSSNTCGTSGARVLAVATTICPRLGEATTQLEVYPNPANSFINLSFNVEQSQQATIILRDAAGRIVYNEGIDAIAGFNNQQIEVSNLAKGVYFVQLQTGDSSENTRLIVE